MQMRWGSKVDLYGDIPRLTCGLLLTPILMAYSGTRLPRLLLILLTTDWVGSALAWDRGCTVQAVVADESGPGLVPQNLENSCSTSEVVAYLVLHCSCLGGLAIVGLFSALSFQGDPQSSIFALLALLKCECLPSTPGVWAVKVLYRYWLPAFMA